MKLFCMWFLLILFHFFEEILFTLILSVCSFLWMSSISHSESPWFLLKDFFDFLRFFWKKRIQAFSHSQYVITFLWMLQIDDYYTKISFLFSRKKKLVHKTSKLLILIWKIFLWLLTGFYCCFILWKNCANIQQVY